MQGGVLRLIDAMGRTVRTWNGSGALHSLFVHDLAPGIYTLQCVNGPVRSASTVAIGR